MDGFASFPQTPFTKALDLDDVVVVRVEGQFSRGFVGDDGVHVVIPVSSVQHYVSSDLRFRFQSNDRIPLKDELRANQIPLYVLRRLSRWWFLGGNVDRCRLWAGSCSIEGAHRQVILSVPLQAADIHCCVVSSDSNFTHCIRLGVIFPVHHLISEDSFRN